MSNRDVRRLDELRLRQQAIGVKLRLQLDHIINEPIPEEWLDLLRQADARQHQAVVIADPRVNPKVVTP